MREKQSNCTTFGTRLPCQRKHKKRDIKIKQASGEPCLEISRSMATCRWVGSASATDPDAFYRVLRPHLPWVECSVRLRTWPGRQLGGERPVERLLDHLLLQLLTRLDERRADARLGLEDTSLKQ